jgi:hypothetical protein
LNNKIAAGIIGNKADAAAAGNKYFLKSLPFPSRAELFKNKKWKKSQNFIHYFNKCEI